LAEIWLVLWIHTKQARLTVDFQYSAILVVYVEDDAGARKIGDAGRELGRIER